ncbi:hypothetical protein HanRHA438_Chr17g0799211 [Helianthus annuus]|nr:hypothetical protein HanRHA438_Chr17g0799211 [Helianthus annuus]
MKVEKNNLNCVNRTWWSPNCLTKALNLLVVVSPAWMALSRRRVLVRDGCIR